MKRVLIDTNVYGAFKAGDAEAVDAMRRPERLLVCTAVLGELLAGFKCGSRERENRRELTEFLDTPRVAVVANDETTAEFYAEVFGALRRKGRPVPTNDMWIAAIALQLGAALCTFDTHFCNIDGLAVRMPKDL